MSWYKEVNCTEPSPSVRVPGVCTIKLFTAVIYGFLLKAIMFVSGKPFQPSIIFDVEARSLP
jgi:hypothetical protein